MVWLAIFPMLRQNLLESSKIVTPTCLYTSYIELDTWTNLGYIWNSNHCRIMDKA